MGSIGGLAGGIFISTWGGLKKKRIYGILVPILVLSIALIIYGLTPIFYVAVAMNFIIFAMVPIANTHQLVIWQTQTPNELLGRVMAVRRFIAQCSIPLSILFAGWFAGIYNPGITLSLLSGMLLIFGVFQFFNPHITHVEAKADIEKGKITDSIEAH